jgi:PAS domain S-box-containing protein
MSGCRRWTVSKPPNRSAAVRDPSRRPSSSRPAGYRNEEHLFRGYDLGAVDFLFKPIVPEVLRSKVAVLVDLSRGNAKLKEQADALRKQADVLRKAEQKFRSLLEAAPDAIVMCRADGEIVMVNSPTEVLLGCGRDKLISKSIRDLVPAWNFPLSASWDGEFDPAGTHPEERDVELFAFRDNGASFPVEITFSPLRTEDGVVITSSIRDISERKKAE